MPRKPIDYGNTHFYKICSKDLDVKDIYVGHTTDFRKRKNHHKASCCNTNYRHHNLYVYQYIREHGGWDNWYMILIETLECSDKLEAKRIERKFIEELSASLNKQVPTRSNKEWFDEHKEHRKEYKKAFHEKNKEQIKEKLRDLYKANKEHLEQKHACEICGGSYTTDHKRHHVKTIKHMKALGAQAEIKQ